MTPGQPSSSGRMARPAPTAAVDLARDGGTQGVVHGDTWTTRPSARGGDEHDLAHDAAGGGLDGDGVGGALRRVALAQHAASAPRSVL